MKGRTIVSMFALILLLASCRANGDADASVVGRGTGSIVTAVQSGSEEVRFTTTDGIVIAGTLYEAGSNAPAVLCLHQWRSDRSSFATLAKKLQSEGFTVLTIDMRGYGGSTKTSDGRSIRPDRKAGADIEAALKFLRGRGTVDDGRIGIIGASYGSSNAVIHAAEDKTIRALVLLSPGLNYFNELPTEAPVAQYRGRPMLVVASSEDLRSVETVNAYREIDAGIESQMYDDAGHGTDILDAEVGLDRAILGFMKKNL